jgi:mannose-6-phosphate isomerase-like protein (cupin superfamily)
MQLTGLFVAMFVGLSGLSQAPAQPPARPAPSQTAPQSPPQTAPAPPAPKRPAATAPRTTGPATFAVHVSDPGGAPIGGVRVSLEGPMQRQSTTEGGGRIAFENLPSGTYRMRFEREGYITLEREQAARGGAPIDVNVTLTSAPAPPPPPPAPAAPPPSGPPTVTVDPIAVDLPAFISKNFIGRRDPQKTSPIGCSTGATATLVQLREPLTDQTHDDFDEFVYVVAGQGTAHVQGHEQPLTPGVLVMLPRGIPHGFTANGKNPVVMLSIRPGEHCSAPVATR